MAEGKSVGGLYIRLGLSLDELKSGFIAAEKTVQQNIARLNRENNLVRLRAEIDTAGLDVAKDATKILAIQEASLTRQLELQRDKLRLASAAYQEAAQNKNINEATTEKLEAAMERERLAVVRLEAELKKLASQKVSIDTTRLNDSIAKINAQIKVVKLKAEIDTTRLKDAGSIFDAQKTHIAAVTRELELQKQKYAQLQAQMVDTAKKFGGDSTVTLNIKSNVLQQYQEIQRLEAKLKELRSTDVNLKFRTDALKQAEQTISENIARINARIENIRVKADVDVSKISGATAEFDKAKAHVQALNRELELQNQKLVEMRNALKNSAIVNGVGNVKTINLATDIQRQIQAIDQLKAKIAELSKIQPPKSGLLSGYLGIKGDVTAQLNSITTAFSNLRGATSSADNALISVLGVIDSIPTPVGKAATALLGLPIIFAGIENSIVDMMKATTAAGDATYVMSRGFQMSVKDTGKFTTMCKTAGVEVNDLASTLKRVQQTIIRGGEDAKAEQWLKRYGESAFDANGRLKDLNAMTLTLSRALKRAQADGNGMAFILGTMRNASADAITAIEDAEGVYEQASHIVKAGLVNPALAHETQGNLNALNVQTAQLGTSFKNALLPVANEIVPRMTERMGKMTQLIKDNKDVILDLGRDFAQVWGNVEDTVDKVGEGLGVVAKLARENRVVRQTDSKTVIERYKDDASVKSAKDLVEREIANGGYSDEEKELIRLINGSYRRRQDLYLKEVKRANTEYQEIFKLRSKDFAEANKSILEKYKGKDFATATDLLKELTDAEKEAIAAQPSEFFGSLIEKVAALNLELKELNKTAEQSNQQLLETLNQSNKIEGLRGLKGDTSPDVSEDARKKFDEEWKRTREFTDELYKITHDEFDNRQFDINKWYGDLVNRAELSAQEREALDKLYAEKSAQIERDRADKILQIRQSINAEFQSELQNRLAKIEEERQAWIKAGMDAAEAGELAGRRREAAIQREIDLVKSLNQSLEDKIFAQEHSQYEQDVRKLQQDVVQRAQELQKHGAFNDEARAKLDRYYQNALGELNKRARESQAKNGDYTKSPRTGGQAQIIDFGKPQQPDIGLFAAEDAARRQVEQGLHKENQALVNGEKATNLAADAQKNFAQTATDAAQSFQKIDGDEIANAVQEAARKIEIIEGDQIAGSETADAGGALSLDELLANNLQKFTESLPAQEMQALTTQTQGVTTAEKDLQESTKTLTTTQNESAKTLSEAASKAHDALKKFSEDTGKISGTRPKDTDVPTKVTKSAPRDSEQPQPEKIPLKHPPQKESGITIGFDYDTFKDIVLTGVGIAAGATGTGVGAVTVPEIAVGTLTVATLGGLAKGTYDETVANQPNELPQKSLSADAGTFADVDFSELATPLSSLDENVQGIRSILQGKDATADATAEGLESTSENSSWSELLTPLNSLDENVQSIWQKLQGERGGEQSAEQPAEISSEVATQIADSVTAPIKQLAQELQAQQATPTEETPTETVDYLTPLTNIRDNVAGMWNKMSTETKATEQVATPQQENLREIFAPVIANINTPLADLLAAIDNKKIELPKIEFPVETIIQPIDSVSKMVGQIVEMLGKREPPKVEISPSMDIDLGGAYVFDDALKRKLVEDITSNIVEKITTAVERATSRLSYG